MARDRSGGCDLGRRCYKTKRDAELASPTGKAERCARCRQWHAVEARKGRRR